MSHFPELKKLKDLKKGGFETAKENDMFILFIQDREKILKVFQMRMKHPHTKKSDYPEWQQKQHWVQEGRGYNF